MERDKLIRFLSTRKELADFCKGLGGLFYSEAGDLAYVTQYASPDGYVPETVLAIQIDPPYRLCLIERQTSHICKEQKKLKKKEKERRNPRQIYLMRNFRNGLTKIGISKSPQIRESCLQSEEPEIKLLMSGPGTLDQERALHGKYAHKRVRGEWFNLLEGDISEISEELKDVNL